VNLRNERNNIRVKRIYHKKYIEYIYNIYDIYKGRAGGKEAHTRRLEKPTS